jgi:quercetin dioxygenase-like cupin family protein
MIEQVFRYTVTEEKTIERIVADETLHINHMVLPKGEGFPEHVANAAVYMTVLRGQLTLVLNGQPAARYGAGDILKIPQGTAMRGFNQADEMLELLVVKRFT